MKLDDMVDVNGVRYRPEDAPKHGEPSAPVTVPEVSAGPTQPADGFPTYTDRPRPEGWETFTDEEKRAYVYADMTPTGTPETPDAPANGDVPPAPPETPVPDPDGEKTVGTVTTKTAQPRNKARTAPSKEA